MSILDRAAFMPSWTFNVVVLALIMGLTLVLRNVIHIGVRRWVRVETPAIHRVLTEPFGASSYLLLLSLLLHGFYPAFRIDGPAAAMWMNGLHVFSIASATWFLMRLTRLFEWGLRDTLGLTGTDNFRHRRARTQSDFVFKIVYLTLLVAGFASVLMTFDGVRRIGTSLIASAGLASVVLGFSAQKSLSNLIAGFQIAFTQPIRLDDVLGHPLGVHVSVGGLRHPHRRPPRRARGRHEAVELLGRPDLRPARHGCERARDANSRAGQREGRLRGVRASV